MSETNYELEQLEERQRMDEELHRVWEALEPRNDTDKVVAAVNALNRSVDRRLEKIVDVLLLLVRSIEHR